MPPFDFIFMLTRNDSTVADAHVHVDMALASGIGHIGFKDIGLPFADLSELTRRIQKAGASAYIEVVSLDCKSELRSVRAAIDLGVDYLLGDSGGPSPAAAGRAITPSPAALPTIPASLKGPRPRSSPARCRLPAIRAFPASTCWPIAQPLTCHR